MGNTVGHEHPHPGEDAMTVEERNAYREQYRAWRSKNIDRKANNASPGPSIPSEKEGCSSAPNIYFAKSSVPVAAVSTPKLETDLTMQLSGSTLSSLLLAAEKAADSPMHSKPTPWRLESFAKNSKSSTPGNVMRSRSESFEGEPATIPVTAIKPHSDDSRHSDHDAHGDGSKVTRMRRSTSDSLTPPASSSLVGVARSASFRYDEHSGDPVDSLVQPHRSAGRDGDDLDASLVAMCTSLPDRGSDFAAMYHRAAADDASIDLSSQAGLRHSADRTSPASLSMAAAHELAKPTVMHKPKPKSALAAATLQAQLRMDVVNQMCDAVIISLVGEKLVVDELTGAASLNPLYDHVFKAVETHFSRMPPRYSLSVALSDVAAHMRLLTEASKTKSVAVQIKSSLDESGNAIEGMNEVTVVCREMKSLLTAITVALSSLGQSIVDADIVTTTDMFVVDRFVVMSEGDGEWAALTSEQLRQRIEIQLGAALGIPSASHDKELMLLESDAIPAGSRLAPDGSSFTDSVVRAPEFKIEDWIIPFSDIHVKSEVGSGRSGITYLATWGSEKVAAKMMDLKSSSSDKVQLLLSEFFQEVAVVSRLRHPNICRFLGAAIDPPRYCIVFEYMDGGDLYHHIRKHRHIEYFNIASDIAQGMHYMHLSNFIHRDLKSGNLLLSRSGVVKVTDFGLSRFLDGHGDMTAETGSYRWMAPEVIRHEAYTKAVDIYSYAMVLLEMLTRRQPFDGLTPVQAAYAVGRDNLRPSLDPCTPSALADLIKRCWSNDPCSRPSFEEIIRLVDRTKVLLSKKEMRLVCERVV